MTNIVRFAIACSMLPCNVHAFTLSSMKNTRTTPIIQDIQNLESSRTKKDLSIERWYRDQGVIGTSCINLCTSEKSVAGRGLFWNCKKDAQKGEILAFVPSKCIATKSNLIQNYPSLQSMENENSNVSISWQAKLTTYVNHCLGNPNDCENRKEWIQSWSGGGPGSPKPASTYSSDEIEHIAAVADVAEDIAREAIDSRYETYMNDWNSVTAYNKDANASERFGDLYSIILSRTASLGPEWEYQRGIIPFHDMINHPPLHQLPNIELFSFGHVREQIGYVHTCDMIRTLAKNEFDAGVRKDFYQYSEPQDGDILLVAREKIIKGDEIWLSYKNHKENFDARERIWLLLQYGFPFHK